MVSTNFQQLLQLRVLGFGFLQDRSIAVGVFRTRMV
jgi:hypothetical protein